jgi:Immunity protein 31
MKAIFDFYEVVSISNATNIPEDIRGRDGVIVGMAENDDGSWEYGVQVFSDDNQCWQLGEDILTSKRFKLNREDIYPGGHIRVNPQK